MGGLERGSRFIDAGRHDRAEATLDFEEAMGEINAAERWVLHSVTGNLGPG